MIRLAVRVAREQAELALAELLELAPAGVEEVELADGRVEYAVYGPPGELPALPDLRALAGGARRSRSPPTEVADDWAERWREFHRPVLVEPPRRHARAGAAGAPAVGAAPRPPGERGRDRAGDRPRQAFGTGRARDHEAVPRAAAGAARASVAPPAAVLDVGTGSGVLAIAAAKLGYEPLLALDNEPESVRRGGRERRRQRRRARRREASTCGARRCRGWARRAASRPQRDGGGR